MKLWLLLLLLFALPALAGPLGSTGPAASAAGGPPQYTNKGEVSNVDAATGQIVIHDRTHQADTYTKVHLQGNADGTLADIPVGSIIGYNIRANALGKPVVAEIWVLSTKR